MLSDNFNARLLREDRPTKLMAMGLILVLSALLWRGDQLWDYLSGKPRCDELLICASGDGNIESMKRAFDQGANVNARSMAELTPLILASGGGNPDAIRLLLKHGADVSLEAETGITALYSAVKGDHAECVEILLQAGADANHQINGATMLDIAIRADHQRAAEVLRQHHAKHSMTNGLVSVGSSSSM